MSAALSLSESGISAIFRWVRLGNEQITQNAIFWRRGGKQHLQYVDTLHQPPPLNQLERKDGTVILLQQKEVLSPTNTTTTNPITH
jgi:hypothetical protein